MSAAKFVTMTTGEEENPFIFTCCKPLTPKKPTRADRAGAIPLCKIGNPSLLSLSHGWFFFFGGG